MIEYTASVNKLSQPLVQELLDNADKLRLGVQTLANGSVIIDAGIEADGGLEAGRIITEICLGGMGTVGITHSPYTENWPTTINVHSSNPVLACLGSQYAGWSLSHDKYYALGSGPARAMATKTKDGEQEPVEELYKELGYQDDGEPGLAGVRVVTPRGLLVTTDDYGRFHIACADVPNELHGSNFIMKLDERTLPSGYRVTTENPRVVRLTRGKLVKLNFGAALHRMLRIDIDATAFTAEGDALTSVAKQQLHELVDILKQQPSQLRLSYAAQLGEEKSEAAQRQQLFADKLTELWQLCDCDHYALTIEKELLMRESATGRAQ